MGSRRNTHRRRSHGTWCYRIELERSGGIPRNPFVNAGALLVTDHLAATGTPPASRLLELLRTESGRPDLHVDADIADSEIRHADRLHAMAYLMAAHGTLRGSVPYIVEQYVQQCAITANCADLATAALFLARHGIGRGGTALLSPRHTKRVNAIMLTCGTYDAAGEFAYRVGLPAKSGVAGGILAVVPGRCTVCVYSPPLDRYGNSAGGVAALDRFTTRTGWSVF